MLPLQVNVILNSVLKSTADLLYHLYSETNDNNHHKFS